MSCAARSRFAAALSGAALLALTLGLPTLAGATEFRRPFDEAINLGYGYDHQSGGGCQDYECGDICYNGHRGSDYPLPYGTTVRAGANGTVTALNDGCGDVGWWGNTCGGGYGNYVRLQHDDGKLTYYAHLRNGSLTVGMGDSVSCGQKIGESASSGNSTGNHLHFEVRVGGVADDPYAGSCGGPLSYWVSQGPYGGRPGAECENNCQCTPGETQTESCGNCGSRSRSCQPDCQWGGWSSCGGQGPCSPGQQQSQSCGQCAEQDRTCGGNCQWGNWGSCHEVGDCDPGETQSGGCGNCGTHQRSCQSDCYWGSWGSCTGQGECSPGSEDAVACGDCGEQIRTCNSSCGWGELGGCDGPDPNGGNDPCDTGLSGPCAEGRVRCVGGWLECQALSVEAELCDDLDNDCDGQVDNGSPAELGDPLPEYAALLLDLSYPQALAAGARAGAWADFHNVGSKAWPAHKVWLKALGGVEGGPSDLHAPDSWPAWNAAAIVDEAVAPGEVARLRFELSAPVSGGDPISESFRLAAPIGSFMRCPRTDFAVHVELVGGTGTSDPGADPAADARLGGGGLTGVICAYRASSAPARGLWAFGTLLAAALAMVSRRGRVRRSGSRLGRCALALGALAAAAGCGDESSGGDGAGDEQIGRAAQPFVFVEAQKLTAADGEEGDELGAALALAGPRALVAARYSDGRTADSGSAYLFTRSGGTWSQEQKLTASDGVVDDWFGISLSLGGDTALVGAHGADDGGSNAGAAYAFVRSGGTWTEQQKLTAPDGAQYDFFGVSLSLDANAVAVGAPYDDDGGADSGSVHMFVRSQSTWTEAQKLTAGDAAASDYFGYAVGLEGNALLVGAHYDDDRGADSGAAYAFVRNGIYWTEVQKLTASDGAEDDRFGSAVSLDGATSLVGAPYHSAAGEGSGAAYLFVRSGSAWTEALKLTASDGASGDWFGIAVSLDGPALLVGASYDDDQGANSGSAYAFARRLAEGDPCTLSAECASGICVDGVCCDAACGDGDPDDCQACSIAAGASANGVCEVLADGASCDDGVDCNGEDQCQDGDCSDHAQSCDGGTGGQAGAGGQGNASAGGEAAAPLESGGGCLCRLGTASPRGRLSSDAALVLLGAALALGLGRRRGRQRRWIL